MTESDQRNSRADERPPQNQPWGDTFHQLPRQMLVNYRRHREASDLGRILRVAHRLQETVDGMVVLGTGSALLGARAFMEGCCQPYFNELSRADRGGKPRMYFGGDHCDNDSLQGLLHLLGSSRTSPSRRVRSIRERWALVVLSPNGEALETIVSFRILLSALREAVGTSALADLVILVTDRQGSFATCARELGCEEVLSLCGEPTTGRPAAGGLNQVGAGEGDSVFSSAGLLPAAILGINVMTLLEGAIAMSEQFSTEPPGANRVLDYAAACHLAGPPMDAVRDFTLWAKALEGIGAWYDRLRTEAWRSSTNSLPSGTMGSPWNLTSLSRQHREGRRDKLKVNVTVENWRTDPLRVTPNSIGSDEWSDLADKSLPEIMARAYQSRKETWAAAAHPMVEIRLPSVDEPSLGQLTQMLMLATVVESRLGAANSCGESDSEDGR